MDEEEKRRFFGSMVFPALLLLLLWAIKLIEVGFQASFADYGLVPQTLQGLRGILLSPLLHADWAHLSSNSVPLFLLSSGLFYYYEKKSKYYFYTLLAGYRALGMDIRKRYWCTYRSFGSCVCAGNISFYRRFVA